MRAFAFPLLAAALALPACSQQAKDETSEASSAVAADVNATAAEAIKDTTAALDAAGSAAGNAADATAAGVRDLSHDAANEARDAGDTLDNAM